MESHAGNANHGAKMTINAVMLDRPTKDAVSLTVDADARDIVFALGALLMAWDFIVKLRPLFPRFVERLIPDSRSVPRAVGGAP